MGAIDRSRGCTIRFHPSGFRVIMYKDAPGDYLDERGRPLTEKLAGEAGFDVPTLAREKAKARRLAEARKRVEEEFSTEIDKIEEELSGDAGDFKVKHVGKGKYAIMDSEGQRLTKEPLTKAQAQTLLDDLKAGGEDHGSTS